MNDAATNPRTGLTPDSGTQQHEPPWLGVHELTEFLFCPRAGLLCYREHRDDTGQEFDGLPRLDYLPDFDTIDLEVTLRQIGTQMQNFMAGTVAGAFGLLVFAAFADWRPAAAIAAAYVIPLRWYAGQWRLVRSLEEQLCQARAARADEPSLPLTEQVRVHWWSLLNAGMVAVEYEDAHRDPELCLQGRPWRVLHRGSQRIPVFRKRSGPAELHEQHFIRMTAYCHLVEACELAEVPYSVVLFGDGYDGIAIPHHRDDRQPLTEALDRARAVITAARTSPVPPDGPAHRSLCRNCPWGQPRRCTDDEAVESSNGLPGEPFLTQGPDGCIYRSPCGDLAGWVPPTERAEWLGLC